MLYSYLCMCGFLGGISLTAAEKNNINSLRVVTAGNSDDNSVSLAKLLDMIGSIAGGMHFGALCFDTELRVCLAIPVELGSFSLSPSLAGSTLTELEGCGLPEDFGENVTACKDSLAVRRAEFSCGVGYYVETVFCPCTASNGAFAGIIVIFKDISAVKELEGRITLEKERYNQLVDVIDCALWEYDIATGKMVQTKKLSGRYSDENLVIPDYYNTVRSWGLVHPDDMPVFEELCSALDSGKKTIDYTLRAYGDNDEYIYMRFCGTCVCDRTGKPYRIVGKTLNVDAEKREYNRLLSKSEHDQLTGLVNKSATREKIEKCFERTELLNSNEKHLLLIVDIDNFKQANDRWGHLYGDYVLEQFARRLQQLFLSSDVVGRIGGDEFIVLRKGLKLYDIKEEIASTITAMTKECSLNLKHGHQLTCSVGAAVYPDDGENFEALFKNADLALYTAKKSGKDKFVIYSHSITELSSFGETEIKNFGETLHPFESPTVAKDAIDVERRLADFSLNLISETQNIDDAISQIFFEVGKYYALGRIYIMELDVMTNEVTVSHEWCNDDVMSIKEPLEGLSNVVWDELVKRHNAGVIFRCDDISTLKTSPELRKWYSVLGTTSSMHYGLFDSGHLAACLVFNTYKDSRRWTQSEIATLTTIAKILSSNLLRNRNKLELKNEMFFAQSMINNQQLSNYAVKPYTYEVLYASEYTEKLFPFLKLGEVCYKAIMQRDTPCDFCPIKGLTDSITRYTTEFYSAEFESWFSTTATSVRSPIGTQMYLLCWSDVSGFIERVKSKDTLTGLLTFERFEADCMQLLSRGDKKYAVMYFDITKFKYINDEWGYSTGNELLKFAARIMNQTLSSDERFCRISGDNFLLLMEYETEDRYLRRVVSNFHTQVEQFKERFPKLNPIISTGVYFMKPNEKDLSIAIDRANAARKTVKSFHKSALAVFDEHLNYRMNREKEIENKMNDALGNGEFHIFFQPKVSLRTGKIIGAEALLRWILPDGRTIMPIDFIPIFEKNGFITELDFFVYDRVFATIRRWLDSGIIPVTISVNVSRAHVNETAFQDKLSELLDMYGITTEYLELELTESIFFDDLQVLRKMISGLRDKGFKISIDDFGSGYSSLNLLKTLPVDILKLDKDFFLQNTMDDRDKTVINSIIQLAKGLGLSVISEGVETEAQVEYLTGIGCDMAQGYYYYKPMPLPDFERQLVKSQEAPST